MISIIEEVKKEDEDKLDDDILDIPQNLSEFLSADRDRPLYISKLHFDVLSRYFEHGANFDPAWFKSYFGVVSLGSCPCSRQSAIHSSSFFFSC